MVLSLALPVLFCLFYFGLQRAHLFPIRPVPRTGLDRHVPFNPHWVWAYQSIYLLMPILPWLATRRETLRRYAEGFACLCGACFLFFLLLPTEGPPQPAAPGPWAYHVLIAYAGSFNAFPSLHAGLTVYTFLFGHRLLRQEMSGTMVIGYWSVATVWTALIFYSTMATRMHWAVDLPAGMAPAIAAHAWAWRRADNLLTTGVAESSCFQQLANTKD